MFIVIFYCQNVMWHGVVFNYYFLKIFFLKNTIKTMLNNHQLKCSDYFHIVLDAKGKYGQIDYMQSC